MKTSYRGILLAATSLFVVGCGTKLVPAPGANRMNRVGGLEHAAVSYANDVEVLVQTPVSVGEEITPIRIVIENRSDKPLSIRYSDYFLIASDGRRFSVLPPFEIDGKMSEPIMSRYATRNFWVAPGYQHYYPYKPLYPGVYQRDLNHYQRYYPRWVALDLPTKMLARALPEGVLGAGGRVEGYLYFEKVPDDLWRVTFRGDFANAESGTAHTQAYIPFVVE